MGSDAIKQVSCNRPDPLIMAIVNHLILVVRGMLMGDIESAMKLLTSEGWNQNEKDWKLLIETPGNVCLVAESGNKVIGTTTAMNYSNQVAWIAMVLVDNEFRSRGVSKAL